ncbi:MAG: LysR family transcriptional regulator substrate-binding protein, partial [Akkermansiaceae bacterium]|nr:LysR family transcriptional regulator substrate-binding protein [Akkermansiaceae bacterium]
CPEIVQRDYLPTLLVAVRKHLPDFHFALESGRVGEIRESLRADRIDLGLATISEAESPGIDSHLLLRIPLVLIVPEDSELTHADQILSRDRIDLPLITLPRHEPACRLFQDELQKRGIDWFPSLELAGLDLISSYVIAGFGIGLALDVPGAQPTPGLRMIPLPGFPEVKFGALTSGLISPLAARFMEEAAAVAKAMTKGA